jgi:hypothetical protein
VSLCEKSSLNAKITPGRASEGIESCAHLVVIEHLPLSEWDFHSQFSSFFAVEFWIKATFNLADGSLPAGFLLSPPSGLLSIPAIKTKAI